VTQPTIRLKVRRKSVIRGRSLVRFPANIDTDAFLTVAMADGTYTFGVDYTVLDANPITDPTSALAAVYDRSAEIWKVVTLSALVASATKIVQTVTEAGPVDILPNAGLVLVNQTVGAAITLNMPLASAKTCPAKIIDWKGDAGTNNITIALSGSDKFQGNVSSWVLGADGASVALDPISGTGYAV
jgi:ethanolamine ammonia-lyase large subunit